MPDLAQAKDLAVFPDGTVAIKPEVWLTLIELSALYQFRPEPETEGAPITFWFETGPHAGQPMRVTMYSPETCSRMAEALQCFVDEADHGASDEAPRWALMRRLIERLGNGRPVLLPGAEELWT